MTVAQLLDLLATLPGHAIVTVRPSDREIFEALDHQTVPARAAYMLRSDDYGRELVIEFDT